MTLELQKVTKDYDDRQVVDEISFTVTQGEFLVLIGPSGCGKTTTLKMINRLVQPSSGSILVDDVDVTSHSPIELRRNIGYVIQHVGLFPHMTVAQNVGTVPRLLKWETPRIKKRTEELLEMMGLKPAEYAEVWPSRLSGGEAQRVGVARALAADPPVLLMDEPFGAVDPLTRDVLQREFLRIQKNLGKTVIFVTHDLDEAIRLGDRIAVMNEGRLITVASPEKLLRDNDPFIRSFTGEDRALRRLARLTVGQVLGDGSFDSVESRSSSHKIPVGSVLVNATLKEALSRMLEAGSPSLEAVGPGGRSLGRLTLEDLLESVIVQEVS